MRSKVSDEALQLPESTSRLGVTTNLSRLLQKLKERKKERNPLQEGM